MYVRGVQGMYVASKEEVGSLTGTDVFEHYEGGEHGDLELHGIIAPQQLQQVQDAVVLVHTAAVVIVGRPWGYSQTMKTQERIEYRYIHTYIHTYIHLPYNHHSNFNS